MTLRCVGNQVPAFQKRAAAAQKKDQHCGLAQEADALQKIALN